MLDSLLPHGLGSPPSCSVHGILQQEHWSGLLFCHFLLQGIFLTQRSNPHLLCLLYWQVGSLPLAPPEKRHLSMRRPTSKKRKKEPINVCKYYLASVRFRKGICSFLLPCKPFIGGLGQDVSCELSKSILA